MILKYLISALGNVKIFKGKECFIRRLGTSRKTVHFQNKRDISKLPSAVL